MAIMQQTEYSVGVLFSIIFILSGALLAIESRGIRILTPVDKFTGSESTIKLYAGIAGLVVGVLIMLYILGRRYQAERICRSQDCFRAGSDCFYDRKKQVCRSTLRLGVDVV